MAQRPRKPPAGVGRASPTKTRFIRPLVWIGSSKADISGMPGPVKASFGHRLLQVQEGKMPLDTKPLPALGAGILELRERFDGNAFRTV